MTEIHLQQLCQQHDVPLRCCKVCRGVAFEVLCPSISSMPASTPHYKLEQWTISYSARALKLANMG